MKSPWRRILLRIRIARARRKILRHLGRIKSVDRLLQWPPPSGKPDSWGFKLQPKPLWSQKEMDWVLVSSSDDAQVWSFSDSPLTETTSDSPTHNDRPFEEPF